MGEQGSQLEGRKNDPQVCELGEGIWRSKWSTILCALGLPEVREESKSAAEEGVSEPLIGGDDNDDDDDQNYSIQASDSSSSSSSSIHQHEAIGFFQACRLPGVFLVRTRSIVLNPHIAVWFFTSECHKDLMRVSCNLSFCHLWLVRICLW